MGKKSLLPFWINLWLVFSSAVCTLDGLYLILRPESFPGGKYDSPLFKGWQIYAKVDRRYNDPEDAFGLSIGRLNFVEIALNIVAIFLGIARNRHARLLAFTASVMTFWKTMVFQMQYVAIPEGAVDYRNPDADPLTWFAYFWIANGIWLVLPALVVRTLWSKIVKDHSDKKDHHNKTHKNKAEKKEKKKEKGKINKEKEKKTD